MQEIWDRVDEPEPGGQTNRSLMALMKSVEEQIQHRSDHPLLNRPLNPRLSVRIMK